MKEIAKRNKAKRGKKNKICFDTEVISKDQAEKLLSEQEVNTIKQNDESEFQIEKKVKKRKQSEENHKEIKNSKIKEKHVSDDQTSNAIQLITENESVEQVIPVKEKKESIRAQKRKKHAEVLAKKKLNAELEMQQRSLNYLSKWKHSRSEWKFEKLKQIWIQQSLFDSTKIPTEFWETTVEYFNGTKGQSRQLALDEALKVIEAEDGSTEENLDENNQLKLKRARDIVQSLQ